MNKTLTSILVLSSALVPLHAQAQSKLGVYCASMRFPKLDSRACYAKGQLRWDITVPKIGLVSTWILEPGRKRFDMLMPKQRTYVKHAFKRMMELARPQLAQLEKQHALETKMLAAATIKPGKSTWNKEKLSGCKAYKVRAPAPKAGLPALDLDLCVQPAEKAMVKRYMQLVQLYRQIVGPRKLIRLQGFPLFDVRLKLYRKDGVLRPGHLPALAVIKSPAGVQALRFDFKKQSVDPAFFAIPKGYTEKKTLR